MIHTSSSDVVITIFCLHLSSTTQAENVNLVIAEIIQPIKLCSETPNICCQFQVIEVNIMINRPRIMSFGTCLHVVCLHVNVNDNCCWD